MGDWNKKHGNLKCMECHEHNRDRERPQSGRSCPRLGTIKLTSKDLRRILIHGKHFPFLTPEEGEKGRVGHWETRMWESCDISVWDTTRELGIPVTRDGDTVKSTRDTSEGRRTNFVLSPEILRFYRPDEVTGLHLAGTDEDTEDQGLSRSLGWCPMKNEWVSPWTGGETQL